MSKFDDFADDARSNSGNNSRRGCGVSHLLCNLPGEDAEKVQEVLADRSVSARAISDALRRRVGGEAPSAYVIGNHRRRNCDCYRELK